MDTITHGLITRLAGKAALPEEKDRGLVNLATFCSVFPDADIVFSLGDSLQSLQNHRGMTHSLVGAVLLGLPIAYIARRWRLKTHGFRSAYLASLMGFLSHIFFDLVTSYGTMILEPFSNQRFALDLWFIIDPYLWLILLVPLLVRAIRADGWIVGYRVGACLMAGYLLLAVVNHQIAISRLTTWAKQNNLQPTTIGALPVAFSPLHQKGIVITAETVYDIPITVTRAEFGPMATYPSAFRPDDPYIERAWETEAGKIYRWFARFPLATRTEDGGKQTVILHDLRFQQRYEDLGWLGRLTVDVLFPDFRQRLDFKRQALEVVFDHQAGIERVEFLR